MSARPPDHATRIARARLSLDGLSLGDAFGERFFGDPDRVADAIAARSLPRGPWGYTDDTVMALAVFEVLWTTVSALGDRDTTCAMVGGVVALTEQGRTVPADWLDARESLSRFADIGHDRADP